MNIETIQIYYPNGKMVLVIDRFFPCLIRQMKIIFPLIRQYADEADKEAVRSYLQKYIKDRTAELTKMEEERASQLGKAKRNYNHTKTMLKRAMRNLEYLEGEK